jgi:hypothetical protein
VAKNWYFFVISYSSSLSRTLKRARTLAALDFTFYPFYSLQENAACHGFMETTLQSNWLAAARGCVSHGFLETTFYSAILFQQFKFLMAFWPYVAIHLVCFRIHMSLYSIPKIARNTTYGCDIDKRRKDCWNLKSAIYVSKVLFPVYPVSVIHLPANSGPFFT